MRSDLNKFKQEHNLLLLRSYRDDLCCSHCKYDGSLFYTSHLRQPIYFFLNMICLEINQNGIVFI